MFANDGESGGTGRVTGVTWVAARLRRQLLVLTRHPLVRTADRIEALVMLGVLVVGLMAIPAAMSAGNIVHEAGLQTAQEQADSRHPVQARVVSGVGLPTDLETPAFVRAEWREAGQTRNESVPSLATVKPGDTMTIWLNDDGKVTAAPMQKADAELQAVVASVTVWTCLVMISMLVAFFIRRGLDRVRDRAWDRELRLLSHNDDGWANRHI